MLPKITGIMRINTKEMRYSASGVAILKLNCVSSEKYNDKEDTCWIECVALGKLAELLNNHFHEKQRIFIVGKLKQDQWQDQQGNKKSKHSIMIEGFDFVEPKQEQQQRPYQQAQPYNHSGDLNRPSNSEVAQYQQPYPRNQGNGMPQNNQPQLDIDQDEIPF